MWSELIAVLIGLLIGGAGVWIWLRGRSSGGGSVEALQKENAQFREEVNEHFVQTAELINRLTDSYKAVFDHLSEGADRLVDKETVRERMPRVTAQEVRLKHIGAPRDEQEK